MGAFTILALIVLIASQPDSRNNLEKRVSDLERRVAQLEQHNTEVPNERPTERSSNRGFENIENWRKLRTNMTPAQVEALLGRHTRIDGGNVAFWHYSNDRMSGRVSFMDGRLFSWSEPR